MSLQEISERYLVATAVHRDLADIFWFLYMPGYALWNEYQFIDENRTQRRVKRYISSTYHVYTPDKLPDSANIAEPLLSGKNRKTMGSDEVQDIIKKAMSAYHQWETETLKTYEKIAAEMLSGGEVSAFNFISDIIKDVKAELVYVTDKIIELSAMDWDMPQIVGEQTDYFERFSHLINRMFKDEEMDNLHHWNSSLEPETRFKKSAV